jgi:hypothetical protein
MPPVGNSQREITAHPRGSSWVVVLVLGVVAWVVLLALCGGAVLVVVVVAVHRQARDLKNDGPQCLAS